MGLALWVLALLVGAVLVGRFVFKLGLFDVAYYLYAHTRVGLFVHGRMLAQAREHGPHSESTAVSFPDPGDARRGFDVISVAFLSDNYAYLIVDRATGSVAAVDPADADAVVAQLELLQRAARESGSFAGGDRRPDAPEPRLTMVLATHRHMDHAGGNAELLRRFPGIEIVGGAREGVLAATRGVAHGDTLHLGESTVVEVIDAPCHTTGHVLFHVRHAGAAPRGGGGALFSGDSLFIGGVGKFFEGTAAQMYEVLSTRIAGELPGDTRVFPGHEYTVENLKFGAHIEPDNEAIAERLRRAEEAREARQPTLPSTVAEERRMNVFMRCREAGVRSSKALAQFRQAREAAAGGKGAGAPPPAAGADAYVQVLAMLRAAKDAAIHRTQAARTATTKTDDKKT